MPSCKCSHPPGGGGKCGSDQLAICRSSYGECHVSCIDIPRDMLIAIRHGKVDSEQVLNLVSSALGEKFYLQMAAGGRARGVGRSGTLVSEDGESVKFSLPEIRKGGRRR